MYLLNLFEYWDADGISDYCGFPLIPFMWGEFAFLFIIAVHVGVLFTRAIRYLWNEKEKVRMTITHGCYFDTTHESMFVIEVYKSKEQSYV